MARANPYLRPLRIFNPDADLAIDEEPVARKGQEPTKTTEDFMSDPLLTLSEEAGEAAETGPAAARPEKRSLSTEGEKKAEAKAETAPEPSSSFDEELGGRVVEL